MAACEGRGPRPAALAFRTALHRKTTSLVKMSATVSPRFVLLLCGAKGAGFSETGRAGKRKTEKKEGGRT